jgi:hypothetical protein
MKLLKNKLVLIVLAMITSFTVLYWITSHRGFSFSHVVTLFQTTLPSYGANVEASGFDIRTYIYVIPNTNLVCNAVSASDGFGGSCTEVSSETLTNIKKLIRGK